MTILQASSSYKPLHASLAISFIVIGGGISGLSAAYALARSGHRVTVLEKDTFDYLHDGEACRMPPNMSKIYFRWGFENKVRRLAVKSTRTSFSRYESDEYLGSHIWDEEYLDETGGDFIFAHNSDLRKLSYQLALGAGATILPNSEVIRINLDHQSVTLASGRTFSADVLVGADGLHGTSRATLLDGKPERVIPTGLIMYNALIRGKDVRADPELYKLWKSPNLYVSCGHRRAALAFPLGGEEEYAIQVYAPDTGSHSMPTLAEFKDAIGIARPSIRKCVNLATRITRTPVEYRADLDDWVHESCPLLLIGGAAHPMPPGAIQTSGMSLEDAGVLGRLFSHLSVPDQIRNFLYAFQELRQERCSTIARQELDIVFLITMDDGEDQQARDAAMKQRDRNKLSVFWGDDTKLSTQWEQNKMKFSYDPEDDADNWWVKWGQLRERAKLSRFDLDYIRTT